MKKLALGLLLVLAGCESLPERHEYDCCRYCPVDLQDGAMQEHASAETSMCGT